MKLKVPSFLTTRPAFLKSQPGKPRPKQLQATTATRRMNPAMDDDYDDEPTTRLSSAFFVVLILHVVAVGGIYAFNSIKAHRRGLEPTPRSVAAASAASPAGASEVLPQSDRIEPDAAPKSVPVAEPPTLAAPLVPAAAARIYHVKAGDTLTRIAQQSSITIAELQMANNLKDGATLKPGQTLSIPATKAAAKPTATTPSVKAGTTTTLTGSKTYAVQKGDTATSIAKKFGVTVEELLKLNKVAEPKKLQLGQTLKVPSKKVN